MNEKQKFSFVARAKSFVFAWCGIKTLLRTEHNAWIHSVAALFAIAAGFILHISSMQWCIIILIIAAVFSLEAVNTAVEALADKVSPEKDPLIKNAKDTASAAVLIMAIAAVVIALIIFVDKINN